MEIHFILFVNFLDIGACEVIMTNKSKQLSFEEHLQTEHSEYMHHKLNF